MKSIFQKAVFFLFLVVSISCGKDAEEVDPNISGTWSRESIGGYDKYVITIDNFMGSSYCHYTRTSAPMTNCQESVSGKARIKKNKLYINSTKWKIDQFPQKMKQPAGYIEKWTMILDGETYYK